jgi:hypothetical protein
MTNRQSEANPQKLTEMTGLEQIAKPSLTEAIKESYGTNFQTHLLDQYKLYVEMADKISARRGQTNSFYISLLSGWLAFLSVGFNKNLFSESQDLVFLSVASLGVVLCLLWYINIRAYKQLNSGKFKVIHEMEKHLPFPCYDMELDILNKTKKSQGYLRLTNVEKYIPFALAIPYLGLLIYSIISLFQEPIRSIFLQMLVCLDSRS